MGIKISEIDFKVHIFFYLCEKYFNNFMKFVHRSVIPKSSHLREIYQHSSKIYCSSEFNAF